eukprot:739002_1
MELSYACVGFIYCLIYILVPFMVLIHVVIFDVRDCIILLTYAYMINAVPNELSPTRVHFRYLYSLLSQELCTYDQCPICYRTFDQIRNSYFNSEIVLLCHHKFCEQCINGLEAYDLDLQCPYCRKSYVKSGFARKYKLGMKRTYFSFYIDFKKYR